MKWFKDPVIIAKMTELWESEVRPEDIAKKLNREISESAIRARAALLGLKKRSYRRASLRKREIKVRDTPTPPRAHGKPSLPRLPEWKFGPLPNRSD